MTNDERDRKISETHTAIMVMAEKVGNHDNTLYGNGQPGLVKDVTLLKAGNATPPGSKRTTVAIITGVFAGVAFMINFIFELVKWRHSAP